MRQSSSRSEFVLSPTPISPKLISSHLYLAVLPFKPNTHFSWFNNPPFLAPSINQTKTSVRDLGLCFEDSAGNCVGADTPDSDPARHAAFINWLAAQESAKKAKGALRAAMVCLWVGPHATVRSNVFPWIQYHLEAGISHFYLGYVRPIVAERASAAIDICLPFLLPRLASSDFFLPRCSAIPLSTNYFFWSDYLRN